MSRSQKKKKDKRRAISVNRPNAAAKPAIEPRPNAARTRWLPSAVGISLVLVGGVVYGLKTNRWTANAIIREAAARLDQIPKTIGDWDGRDLHLPESHLKQAGAVGHIYRVYRNRETNEEVQVMFFCGSFGPISVHSPTVCFVGAGWHLEGSAEPVSAVDGEGKHKRQFWRAQFRKESVTGVGRMRTYWSWNASGEWSASDHPRMQFAGAGYLYKLYIMARLPSQSERQSDESGESDACRKFMRAFLPAVKQAGISR